MLDIYIHNETILKMILFSQNKNLKDLLLLSFSQKSTLNKTKKDSIFLLLKNKLLHFLYQNETQQKQQQKRSLFYESL